MLFQWSHHEGLEQWSIYNDFLSYQLVKYFNFYDILLALLHYQPRSNKYWFLKGLVLTKTIIKHISVAGQSGLYYLTSI